MRLIDVVTLYLYGSLDNDIYIKIPEGYKMPEAYNSNPKVFILSSYKDLYAG